MDSYKIWKVVSVLDETPLRVYKALSHLGLNIFLALNPASSSVLNIVVM